MIFFIILLIGMLMWCGMNVKVGNKVKTKVINSVIRHFEYLLEHI